MVEDSLLGKVVATPEHYSPALLFPVPRADNRRRLGLVEVDLPFFGSDRWQAWEVSWLEPSGKPCVAMAVVDIPCASPAIIESKSFKLYLNSFNQTCFASRDAVVEALRNDLSATAGAAVEVKLYGPDQWSCQVMQEPAGQCLDSLPLSAAQYTPSAALLRSDSASIVSESYHSHLLRSLCPVTGQPDWATVTVDYRGPAIEPHSLLAYIVSFRQHQDFHEHCVEQIFVDLLRCCQPLQLTVSARYLRRGGLDINPLRSTAQVRHSEGRMFRQ